MIGVEVQTSGCRVVVNKGDPSPHSIFGTPVKATVAYMIINALRGAMIL